VRRAAGPTAAELIEFCARGRQLQGPRQIEFRTDLPRNPAGKPLKRLLRQES
jgi:acyl-CoA synthetase (AMP-forming)/AMP-acid ligase II